MTCELFIALLALAVCATAFGISLINYVTSRKGII